MHRFIPSGSAPAGSLPLPGHSGTLWALLALVVFSIVGPLGSIGPFALTGPVAAQEADTTLRVLFLGDNGHHQPQRRFLELQPYLEEQGIELSYTDRVSDLNLPNLKRYDALLLYANIDEIAPDQAEALLQYVAEGGGFVPLHCATYCFRNSPEVVALMGGQFQRHGTGVFRTEIAAPDHPVMKGFGGFESWDETYVHHLHNEKDRTVLSYRVDDEGREPWTWVRTQGDGRVFYTAWGHDQRTWTHPGFQNLVERGIRWAAGGDPQIAGPYQAERPFPVPKMTEMPTDRADFEYVDVGGKIPNYTPSSRWGTQGEPLNLMQKPLPPEESIKHLVVPEGFHVELFASEPDLGGKPICMAWDERGRLWVAETYDYPNELRRSGEGRDRIRICEDTDGDGRADKFTVFAEQLSIPTTMAFHRGGVLVQNGTQTLFLKDTDGDDKADQRDVLIEGWELGDTHGGVSNFQYGLDNWIWAMQGYNNSAPVINDQRTQRFRMGFFRIRPDGSEIEFIRSTNNNTWGLGISEEGLIFGSTANGCPSVYMPIPNRYYEQVQGWTPSLTLNSIADTNNFSPITDKVRQVDHHGGYTAGAGHALYTAREYPREYWNRVAFVNGPTGHLVGSFVLNHRGTEFHSTSPFNLLASDDEWTAPIMAEVGPDGQVWVIDWYNFIVQHNPTPIGFKTGRGAAYETDLRDKKHGRIYRVVADSSTGSPVPDLSSADADQLVQTLTHPTMLVRKHAQRLLVERGQSDVVDALLALVADRQVDEIGLNVGAIHALWTLQGLGLLDGSHENVNEAVFAALQHPSPGVRRNALQVLPPLPASVQALVDAGLHRDNDPNVRLAAILAMADLPAGEAAAGAIRSLLNDPNEMNDRWIPDAITSAAAHNSEAFLTSLADLQPAGNRVLELVALVAEHHTRSESGSDPAKLLAAISDADPRVVAAVLEGVSRGWKADREIELADATESKLESMIQRLPSASRGTLVKLAGQWGSERFRRYQKEIADSLLKQVRDQDLGDRARITAADQLIEFMPDDRETAVDLLDEVTPRTPPEVAAGIMRAFDACRWDGIGEEIVSRLGTLTPGVKKVAYEQLLRRPQSTMALLDAADAGTVSLDQLALDQKQSLRSHPSQQIAERAKEILERGGSLPNADRQEVLNDYLVSTKSEGDVTAGKAVFKEHCSKCHMYGDMGANIGPNLTGMAVHPKEELLTHILDPSRNVEGNFRAYNVLTVDGVVLSGMLASESKTAVELFDTEGKRQSVLRDDIEELVMSTKSIMPEGFEKSINKKAMTDLLEFLTDSGPYVPIPLDRYATAISTKGLFSDSDNGPDRLIFSDWKPKLFEQVPFLLTDPKNGTQPNIILLHGPRGSLPPKMPRSVSLPCNTAAKAIHLLSGVGGWSFPFEQEKSVTMIVRLHYADGKTEDHELINGVHFADYIRRVDVPKSEFAFELGNQQIRYLSVAPERSEKIESIELVKGEDATAPIVMAVTIETPQSSEEG
ncbi:c-type cytochrome [Roseiconus nitratireducens]|uniref:C-type cytochrome n=1 Tax=Roseiconus nitratireducens TaxID=2605748 RepID=A0A5M6DI07_9BACT|nr:PVC-type heme-binding CxxCH protein [Roseiconus nitratireducens]KAA5547161.1 c-type cytochrome [Roseiconus nitratireducens]